MRWVAPFIALGALGCAHAIPLDREEVADSAAGPFVLRYAAADADAARQVQLAIERAAPRLASWGHLRAPVTVLVEPSHDELERAVDRRGFGWLRAWARYRQVWVQSPATWGILRSDQQDVDELLLHELTHCVMYQLAANEDDWSRKGIPLWFREGMASYTAKQGYRRGTLVQLAGWYRSHKEDPIADAEALYQEQADVVYGAAHQAFTYLVDTHGVDAVQRLLQAMQGGLTFDAAFQQAVGTSRRAFERQFADYVRLARAP
ncbi:MAG: hypothetical protein JST54_27320 [Deltaproteobacteria bacterium]|nr:hypothetical protein [Deltaproteobacteria bacterium]